jgi:hypothetical protein
VAIAFGERGAKRLASRLREFETELGEAVAIPRRWKSGSTAIRPLLARVRVSRVPP